MSPRRLPVASGARIVRALEKDGFKVISTKGSHCKLRRGPHTVIIPLHDEVRPGTLASILRAAGMSADELRALLWRQGSRRGSLSDCLHVTWFVLVRCTAALRSDSCLSSSTRYD